MTVSCAHSEQGVEIRVSEVQPQEVPAPSEANEVLSAGDVFELKVFNEEDLSGEVSGIWCRRSDVTLGWTHVGCWSIACSC